MRYLVNIACLTASAFLTVGCATHQTAKLDATAALRAPSTAAAEPAASGTGKTSGAWGDWWTAANLFEQAEAGHDSPINRFNLAACYQNTGRTQQAQALYRSVVRDGQFINVKTISPNADPRVRDQGFNLADEALRRLALNARAGELARLAQNGAQTFFAEQAAVVASTTVGPMASGGRVDDAEAQRRDAANESH